jgi:outer membrane lipoprotein SlyB
VESRLPVKPEECTMTTRHLAALALVPALLSGCVTATTTTRTWGESQPAQPQARYGRVESIRETVRRTEGNPAAGAVAGGVIGALLGSAIGGHSHYDRYGRAHHHGSAAGAVAGAIGGAVVGANASQGQRTDRTYEAFVRFEDGSTQTFVYAGSVPFRPGDEVVQTEQGVYPR